VIRALVSTCENTIIVACLHDIYSQKFLRSNGILKGLLMSAVMKEELRLIKKLDTVMTLSKKDAGIVQSLYLAKQVHVKPFIPPDWITHVDRRTAAINVNEIIFFANFFREENIIAVDWFIKQSFPLVLQTHPKCKLILIGTGSDIASHKYNNNIVSGTGFIENPAAYFSTCLCSIAPLFSGAGIKFKVLESLACNVPVIGTEIAFEGVEHHDNVITTDHLQFHVSVINLINKFSNQNIT
jgi:glycosyltransferase involved in cell wall biosynthesis